MADIDYVEEFQRANLNIANVIKNTAEFLVVTGLFSFIGKAYQSPQAEILSSVLLFALGLYIATSIQQYTLMIPRLGKKYYGPLFALSVAAAFAIAASLQIFVLAPTLKAIERQLAAAPAALRPQAVPALVESNGRSSPTTVLPKSASVQKPSLVQHTPGSTAPPSAPSRTATHEACGPDCNRPLR